MVLCYVPCYVLCYVATVNRVNRIPLFIGAAFPLLIVIDKEFAARSQRWTVQQQH
jgi:hypothetical protein